MTYTVLQKGSNGVHITKNGSSVDLSSFTQSQINNGEIRLENRPGASDDKFDVIVMDLSGNTKVLFVRVEPIALQLFNHTTINIVQGQTYIVLERYDLIKYKFY